MGTQIHNLNQSEVVATVLAALREGRGGSIVTPNIDNLRIISASPELAALVSRAELVVADGMPLVWASRLQGTPLKGRVNGTELVLAAAAALALEEMSMFLLGAAPGVAESAASVLRTRAPGLEIAGTLAPELGFEDDPEQMRAVTATLQDAEPSLVVCALGCPKQERVMAYLRPHLPSTWFIGAGSALTIIAGVTPRAPAWMSRNGLEWLHRMRLEPARLGPRYILHDLPFAARLFRRSAQARFSKTTQGNGHRLRRAS